MHHHPVFTRRQMLVRLGVLGAGLGLAPACSGLDVRAAFGSRAAPTATTLRPEAARGGSLTLGQTATIASTNPFPSSPALNAFRWAMFNPLITLDEQKQPAPALAETWTLGDNGRRLTLKLRSGVKFHSGRPLNAGVAKWNLEFAQDPKNQSASGGELASVKVSAIDTQTLELTLPDPYPHIFSLLAGVLIADPESDLATNAAGTGAFRVDGLEPGNELRLVRNTNYWRPNRPHLDAVRIRTLPDPQSAVVALETGAVDVAWVAASDVRRLRSTPGLTAEALRGSGSYEFLISAVDEPFGDKRVRQAIGLAMDRNRFANTLMYGLTEPAYTLWLRASPIWDPLIDVGEFNLERARTLLSEAGHPNGFQTHIGANAAYPELTRFAEVVQADLARIGVTLSIEPMEAVQAGAAVSQGKFSALMTHAYGSGDLDPALQFTTFVFRPNGNASRFVSADYTRMVDAARREPDWQTRLGLYRQLDSYLKDQAFVQPIANVANPFGLRANVQGFARQPLAGSPVLEDLWLS